MIKFILALLISLFAFVLSPRPVAEARDDVTKPKLKKIVEGKGWKVINRTASTLKEKDKKGVRFDEKEGAGFAWLDSLVFRNGTIEFDVRGRNVLQKSFVGVAFQAADENNYDLVYFRPFNFRSDDPARRSHSVQYMAAPDHDWRKLRAQFPGKYENSIESTPDPDGWFHARIVVDGKKVNVFVDNAAKPVLEVEKLTESREGKIGLWLGDESDGQFANLKITRRN